MKISADDLKDIEDLKLLRRRLAKKLKDGVLDDEITFPQLLNAMIAIGRIMTIEQNLQKNRDDQSDNLGVTVRKYERAFAGAYASRRRTADTRPRLIADDDSELSSDFDTDA